MVERRRSYRVLVVAIALPLGALFACTGPCANHICQFDTPPRVIEDVCSASVQGQRGCSSKGDVHVVPGITEDSNGFSFGASGGSLLVHLDAFPGTIEGTLDIDVLAAAAPDTNGSNLVASFAATQCSQGQCLQPPKPVRAPVNDAAYRWVNVASASNVLSLGPDVVMTITGSNLQIADFRVHATFSEPLGECSIARGPGVLR